MKSRLLIVEEDEEIRTQMKWCLANDHDIVLANDRAAAVVAVQTHHPIIVLLDLDLPPCTGDPCEGLAMISEILSLNRLLKVIIITGHSGRSVALRAIGAGAFDFLSKPMDMEELKLLVRRTLRIINLEAEFQKMQPSSLANSFQGMIGNSSVIRALFDAIRKVASTEAPVLLLGESGTGKEMAARAIHQCSERRDGPFIAINCGAIPQTLIESELFGHEKGAFTGAYAQRKGKFEMADGGTLFLDEIGEIPPSLQVKLLRFMAEQCIERVGGRCQIRVNSRVVAATNVNLRQRIAAGTFREDLYYRLSVVVLTLPPLHDRLEDIRLLAQYFLERFRPLSTRPGMVLTLEALQALDEHPWPGNVRELENCIRRAVIMADGRRLDAHDLGLVARKEGAPPSLNEARRNLEWEMIQAALRRHDNAIAAAARELGVNRSTLYNMMRKHQIVAP